MNSPRPLNEEDLRAALRREAPPDGFAAAVIARATQTAPPIELPLWRRPAAWAMAAALALAALLPPAAIEYRRSEEKRALEARNELFTALRITRAKLQQTRERVQRATARHAL